MCGISGFIGFQDHDLIHKMISSQSHRGPDASGFFQNERISLGHNRLSIIDLSQSANQPMTNETGSVQVVYNGEIYNYKQLRTKLIGLGHVFKSNSDTEVIVHGYEQFGERVVDYLEGMFAFAVWDQSKKKLLLARDPMGIKPLYYYIQGQKLIFSSEIKAILQCEEVKKQLSVNEASFYFYLTFQFSPSQKTLFSGIKKLEPGCKLVYEKGNFKISEFCSLDMNQKSNEKDLSLATQELLSEAVKKRLMSDVPLGVLLSGGLDSSAVTVMVSQHQKVVHTFTAGFNQKNDEFNYAKFVAQKYKTKHHEFCLDAKQVQIELPKILWHMDEPLADGGAIATYFMSQYLKDYVKVVLVGEGADEVLGGYSWHHLSRLKFLPKAWRLRAYYYLTSFTASTQPWMRQSFEKMKHDFLAPLVKPGDDVSDMTFFQQMSYYELTKVLPNHLLMKVDKMTMAHSIEARVPFLDKHFVEHLLSVDDRWKIKGRYGKYILRQLMQDLLPQEILHRKKQGFSLPLKKWLEGDLREIAYDMLSSSNAKCFDFVDKTSIKKLLGSQHRGLKEIERVSLLWRLLVFEIWHDVFFNQKTQRLSSVESSPRMRLNP